MPQICQFLGVKSVTNIELPKGVMPALICNFADWFEIFTLSGSAMELPKSPDRKGFRPHIVAQCGLLPLFLRLVAICRFTSVGRHKVGEGVTREGDQRRTGSNLKRRPTIRLSSQKVAKIPLATNAVVCPSSDADDSPTMPVARVRQRNNQAGFVMTCFLKIPSGPTTVQFECLEPGASATARQASSPPVAGVAADGAGWLG